jgi:hypothetical protein
MATERFPGIQRAALEIAYDNGGVNRTRPQAQMLREFHAWLAKQPQEPLPKIDEWLSSLSDEQLNVVCTGEHSEMEAAIQSSPPFTNDLLNRYFNEVC